MAKASVNHVIHAAPSVAQAHDEDGDEAEPKEVRARPKRRRDRGRRAGRGHQAQGQQRRDAVDPDDPVGRMVDEADEP